MTDSNVEEQQQDPELAAVASQLGECPDCGEQATRLVSRYPGKATAACAEGHQWDVDITEK